MSALRDVYPYCIWEELVIPTRASGGDDGYCDATPWQPQGSGVHREGHCHVVFMQSGNVMVGDWFSLQPDGRAVFTLLTKTNELVITPGGGCV